MSLTRQHSNPYASPMSSSSFTTLTSAYPSSHPSAGAASSSSRLPGTSSSSSTRTPLFFRRLFKFRAMDFEYAVWEMSALLFTPRKPWRQVMYRKQTKGTFTSSDPAFLYLFAFFLLLSSLAWSLAYAEPAVGSVIRVAVVMVALQMVGACVGVATLAYFGIWWGLGPRGRLHGQLGALTGNVVGGMAGARRNRGGGLFGVPDADARREWEWGYCFDVTIRSFFLLWVYLYVVQFILLPAVTSHRFLSVLLSNLLHLIAFSHASYTTFLGYNALPALSSTHVLLAIPLMAYVIMFILATATGVNASLNLAPILWCFGGLRKTVG